MSSNSYYKSKLNDTIVYDETKTMNDEDKGNEFNTWTCELKQVVVEFSLGKEQYKETKGPSSDTIMYFPIYLWFGPKFIAQIGIFEVIIHGNGGEIPRGLFLEDGEIDADKLGDPILYDHFVTKEYLEKYSVKEFEKKERADQLENERKKSDLIRAKDKKEEKDRDQQRDDSSSKKKKKSETIVIEEEAAYKEIQDQFKAMSKEQQSSVPWVAQMEKNPFYEIVRNNGAGDCFFIAVQQAFDSIDTHYDITKMRVIVSENVTRDHFNTFNEVYMAFGKEIQEIDQAIHKLNIQKKTLKKNQADDTRMLTEMKEGKIDETYTEDNIRKMLKKYEDELQKVRSEISKLTNEKEKQIPKENNSLSNQFQFMKGVETFEDFKKIILTNQYWANEMAIDILENKLNVSFIILSRDYWEQSNGSSNAVVLVRGRKPEDYRPKHYVILSLGGEHYELVSYRSKSIFTYQEIPWGIRSKVMDKINESGKDKNNFSGIREFLFEMDELDSSSNKKGGRRDVDADISDDNNNTLKTNQFEIKNDLYDPDIVFVFYSHSADKFPGKGMHEKLPKLLEPHYIKQYRPLYRKYPEFRRMLSNYYVAPFELDHHNWNTVEHYYQASKFKKENPDFYRKFTLDADDANRDPITGKEKIKGLSKNPAIAKLAGSESGKVGSGKNKKKKIIRPSEIHMDEDFFKNGNSKKELRRAMAAKFEQNPTLMEMLQMTYPAKLYHYVKGEEPILMTELMELRQIGMKKKM